MASSRRPNDTNSEPFPAFGGQDETTTSVTTSTTTQTVIGGDGNPVIRTSTTPAHPTGQAAPITFTTDDPNNAPVPFTRTTVVTPAQSTGIPQVPVPRRRPVGIRRLPSAQNTRSLAARDDDGVGRSNSGRKRAASAPQEPHLAMGAGSQRISRQNTRQGLPPLQEESSQPRVPTTATAGDQVPPSAADHSTGVGRRRSISNAARSIRSRLSADDSVQQQGEDYGDEVVDLLDVIDPEVQTLNTLTNVQNSLFVPNLGRWLNRNPTYTLTRGPSRIDEVSSAEATPTVTTEPKVPATPGQEAGEPSYDEQAPVQRTWSWQRQPRVERSHSITSVMTDSHYAVLPHGVQLEDWSEEDKEALDDHVRHMLHSKRSKFKQRMRAFGKYVSKRKSVVRDKQLMLMTFSIGLPHHLVRNVDHLIRSGLGTFPYRQADLSSRIDLLR